ncbi:MAG: DUF362 domain-containing protein [bacterium]
MTRLSGGFTRRDFLKTAAGALACAGLLPVCAASCKSGFSRVKTAHARKRRAVELNPGVFVARGTDPRALTLSAVRAAGGIEKLVRKGDRVVIKPNMSWDRAPRQAATTNPDVVAALVELSLGAGAASVLVVDRPCNEARRTYEHSGVARAAERAGARVPLPDERRFVVIPIPDARVLKTCPVNRDVLEADVFINVPIVKHHGYTRLTIGLKNLMGCAGGDRGFWHRDNLHQRIADIALALPADLTVVDAFRVLTAHGPQGGHPDDVREVGAVAAAADPVAADAFGASLLGADPRGVDHIRIAHEMGLGEIDLSALTVEDFSV